MGGERGRYFGLIGTRWEEVEKERVDDTISRKHLSEVFLAILPSYLRLLFESRDMPHPSLDIV